MPFFNDRVRETTTVSGTGTITLLGAVPGFQSFSAGFSVGSIIAYAVIDNTTGEWEVGRGTLATSSTITRDIIKESSNADAIVNFSTSNTKDVFATINGDHAMRSNIGKHCWFPGGSWMQVY